MFTSSRLYLKVVVLKLCATNVYHQIAEDCTLLEKAVCSVGRTRTQRGGFRKLHSEGV